MRDGGAVWAERGCGVSGGGGCGGSACVESVVWGGAESC